MNYGNTGYGYSPMMGARSPGLSGGLGDAPRIAPFQKADTGPAADERRLQILKALGIDEGMLHDFFKGRQAFNTYKSDLKGALGDATLGNGTGGFTAATDKFKAAFQGQAVDPETGLKVKHDANMGATEGPDAGSGEGALGSSGAMGTAFGMTKAGGKVAALKSL